MNRLGAKVYSFVFFGMALASNTGIMVSKVIIPSYGWGGAYLFYGVESTISLTLLLFFSDKPSLKRIERNFKSEDFQRITN